MTRPFASILLILSAVPSSAQTPSAPIASPAVASTVSLPLADYERLVERAEAAPSRPDSLPMPAAALAAVLDARAEGGSLRGTLVSTRPET